jgi:endonuclease/exonuclease/phosphatase family metal-dependent hydrolase
MTEKKWNPIATANRKIIYIFACVILVHAGPLKVATYNLMNFPGTYGHERLDDFKVVLDYIKPDILVAQEVQSEEGQRLILDSVFNCQGQAFSAPPFHDGFDTDNSLFFNTAKLEFKGQYYIATPHRDIARYDLLTRDSRQTLHVFSVHFKSSQGYENEMIRLQEATILRQQMDTLSRTGPVNVLAAGDFNFYYCEPAYEWLMASHDQDAGRLYDPANATGTFHDNRDIAYLHTQSTRLEALPDSGAPGGLDDRFDMILCSRDLLDTAGLMMAKNTYTACGNDAGHFNHAVNFGINQAVPSEVADALYYASDHLPVYVTILYTRGDDEKDENIIVTPNPMNATTRLIFPRFDDFRSADIVITNIFGKKVLAAPVRESGVVIDNRDRHFACGIYFVHVTIRTEFSCHKYLAKMAVVY